MISKKISERNPNLILSDSKFRNISHNKNRLLFNSKTHFNLTYFVSKSIINSVFMLKMRENEICNNIYNDLAGVENLYLFAVKMNGMRSFIKLHYIWLIIVIMYRVCVRVSLCVFMFIQNKFQINWDSRRI